MQIRRSAFVFVASALAVVLMTGTALAGTWTPVKTLQGTFAASSPPEAPVVAVNGAGHAVVAWDVTGVIRYAEYVPGTGWTASRAVVPGAAGGPVTTAIGSDGTTAVAWTTVGTRYVPSKLVVSVRSPGGTFPAPTTVAPGAMVFSMKLGIAGDGKVTLVWADGVGIEATTLSPGGTWSAPTLISSAGTSANLPDLVVNDTGAALAVWQEGGMGAPAAIGTAYRPAGGAWEAPQVVSGGSGLQTWNPKPGIDAAGDAAVGFLDGNTMMVASRSAAGPWAVPVAVSGPTQMAYYPALAMDQAGDLVAAWQVLDAGNVGSIYERTMPAGGTWGATTRLSGRLESADWPTAAFSGDGTLAVVTWVDDTAQKARASVGTVAGPWTRSTLGTGWWGSTVPVGAGAGTVTAAWAVPNLANPNAARIVGRAFL